MLIPTKFLLTRNDDEPDDPNKGSGSDVNVENINGTWKGIFKGYTGTRDELITIIFSGSGNEGSVRIWWTHYLNMGQYYFTGDYKLSGNKLTLDGKMGQHGQIPSKPYNKTVTVKFIDKEKQWNLNLMLILGLLPSDKHIYNLL